MNSRPKTTVEKHKDVMIRLLQALHPDAKVYLFGSYARGNYTQSSDIDIALDVGRKMTFQELCVAENILKGLNFPEKMDIIDLNNISEEFKAIVIKEIILWSK
jgi:predicted nucleotidyltransferase